MLIWLSTAGSALAFTLNTYANPRIAINFRQIFRQRKGGLRNRGCQLFSLTESQLRPTNTTNQNNSDKVPITLLSGFLGSGKTSALQHLLKNTDNIKIGVLVNDVASVNIDAQLFNSDGVAELENGCVCCSLADELLISLNKLMGKRSLDALVVELSGVSDPIAVRNNWNTAKLDYHPVTRKAEIAQVVTLVDACTFGTDWMSKDDAGDRKNWVDPIDERTHRRKISELLAEQVEAADLILVNKKDLAGEDQVQVAISLVESMNAKAIVEATEFGQVKPHKVLPGVDDDNFQKAKESEALHSGKDSEASNHSHSSHSHDHDHYHDDTCNDPDCIDPSHNHDHNHDHSASHHSPDQLGITNFVYKSKRPFDPLSLRNLLDQWPVPIKDDLELGILQDPENGYEIRGNSSGENKIDSPFVGVLRSKGFCWIAPSVWIGPYDDVWRHDTAMYWSHAGKHFRVTPAGKWWETIGKDGMKSFFVEGNPEYDRILKEDFVSSEFGDRRQELVFIGVDLDENGIRKALDGCLMSDAEVEKYKQELDNYMNSRMASPSQGGLFDWGYDQIDMQ